MDITASKIAALNDALRKRGEGGRILLTQGIQALEEKAVSDIIAKIRAFDEFTEDNDPYQEHDFGAITINGNKVFWKISYYDRNLKYASPDPSDAKVTCRVMTVMMADEY